MPRPREPIELVIAKGRKNLTKAEIETRRASEVHPAEDEIEAPAYLTPSQRKHFDKLARQLRKIKILGETDCETLARYVSVQELYEQAVKDLRSMHKQRPRGATVEELVAWTDLLEGIDRRIERYCKQASALARDLGLTIASRCKLVLPASSEEEPKINKFARFEKAAGHEE